MGAQLRGKSRAAIQLADEKAEAELHMATDGFNPEVPTTEDELLLAEHASHPRVNAAEVCTTTLRALACLMHPLTHHVARSSEDQDHCSHLLNTGSSYNRGFIAYFPMQTFCVHSMAHVLDCCTFKCR